MTSDQAARDRIIAGITVIAAIAVAATIVLLG
jgi:hypothetical protein